MATVGTEMDEVRREAVKCPSWVLCHEHHRSKRRCGTGREMKEGPFGFGDQVADPKPPQAAVVKSHGGVVSRRCESAMLYER